MSKINQALSELARQANSTKQTLQPAAIPAVKSRPVLPWLIGGFALSMAVGSWSLSYQSPSIQASVDAPLTEPLVLPSMADKLSPTNRTTTQSGRIYSLQSEPKLALSQPQTAVDSVTPMLIAANTNTSSQQTTTAVSTPALKASVIAEPTSPKTTQSPTQLAAKETKPSASLSPQPGSVHIEQVVLTPQQLAHTAQLRAQKALDSNNLSEAIDQYEEALRYVPGDEKVRQSLSALYYGKGEIRKSADLLQQGIERNVNSQGLRIALAKLLIKESQQQAALTPLLYLPDGASEQYLSLRAALAQKTNQDEIAKQSYQKLVQIAPSNGRWWMGLGIQQERALQIDSAAQSYTNALQKMGLSSQSQQFIRQRLALLKQLEGQPSAN